MLCPNLNIKNNVIIKKRYVGCSSCRGTISQRLREPQPTILIFISSLMLYLMISHTFTWKKQNATTLPPRRVEKTAIAQLTASEESFNSLKLGCRELWSLVSARSDVPDLFFGTFSYILWKYNVHWEKETYLSFHHFNVASRGKPKIGYNEKLERNESNNARDRADFEVRTARHSRPRRR